MKKNMKKIQSFKKGFTLVEAMIAVAVLSTAVTGPLVIAQKGLASAIYTKDEVSAFYLAQEAVEYVRNIRDTNRIAGSSWLNGLAGCIVNSGGVGACEIDATFLDFTNLNAVKACSGGTCSDYLLFNNTSGLYNYGSGNPTKFVRSISMDNRASSKEATVSVTISWQTNLFSAKRTFTVQETIFHY